MELQLLTPRGTAKGSSVIAATPAEMSAAGGTGVKTCEASGGSAVESVQTSLS